MQVRKIGILKVSKDIHRKKRFTSFPSPAGMSLTKLPLGRNNSVMTSLFPTRESLVVTSRLGTGNFRTFFFTVYFLLKAELAIIFFIVLISHKTNNQYRTISIDVKSIDYFCFLLKVTVRCLQFPLKPFLLFLQI